MPQTEITAAEGHSAEGHSAEGHSAGRQTIAAIATPLGAGGIGIVRVSGPGSEAVLRRLFTPAGRSARPIAAADAETVSADKTERMFADRHLYLGEVRDLQGELLDRSLAVMMYAPHSYTGEDVAEFQLHGGPPLLRSVLRACLEAGARLAQPGEFTLRAFLNGKLDLAQAEAVADLVSARTARASRQAADQLAGRLSARVSAIEDGLTETMALITEGVDFPVDADVLPAEQLMQRLDRSLAEIDALLATSTQGRVVREGIRIALAGVVNAGKSSLLNRLLETERAIVTALPGTTRDLIEETMELDGIPLLLTDTAGFRDVEQMDQVERIGVELSGRAVEQAQLLLILIDGTQRQIDAETRRLIGISEGRPRLLLINKIDLVQQEQVSALRCELIGLGAAADEVLCISAKQGSGMDELRTAILRLAGAVPEGAAASLVCNARHEEALLRARTALEQARQTVAQGVSADLAGIDVEDALSALGEISGRSVSETVLSTIFSRFCLGK